MKYDITSDACRICLRKTNTCRSIFKPLGVGEIAPNTKLNLIAGVNVTEKEEIPGLPQFICKQCEISVNMAYNLRKKARKSDQILSVYCNQMNKDNIIVELANGRKFKLSKELTLKVIRKNEPTTVPLSNSIICNSEVQFGEHFVDDIDDENDDNAYEVKDENADDNDEDDNDEDDDYYDDDNDNDNDIENDNVDDDEDDDKVEDHYVQEGVKIVSDSEVKCDIAEEKVFSFKIENNNENDRESSDNTNRTNINTPDDRVDKKRQQIYNGEEIAKKIKASNQYELVSWTQEDDANAVPTFKLRVKEPEEKTLPKDFICEVCGNTYSQRHRLMEHMRRHNPEKIYACEICGKRFAVSEGLRRHVLTHGAKKPFKCNYCTRCFYTPSARKAHEKIHSGDKPFVCKICSKAFAYTGSLWKHMLIHENKKLYRCEYCDKEFRLQHHMKQHEETQIHKDALAECIRPLKNKQEFKHES